MPNGIHTIEDIILFLAENSICNSGWKHCGQKYFMADELEIDVGELEIVCEYLNIDLEKGFKV